MKAVASVFSTTDYSSFKKLNGNREVMESRKKLLMESIVERGWIRNPIVVNEKMEIIDGQGRFEALKELRLPVEYVVAPGATIQDCINLNVKQKNWTHIDYIDSYSANGVKDYQIIKDALNKYKSLGITVCITLLCGATDGTRAASKFKSGNLKISDPSGVDDILLFSEKCFEIIGANNGRLYAWAAVIKFVYYCDKIDKIRFMKQLSTYHIMISPVTTVKQCLMLTERIYNYNYSKKNKVYFIPEYEKATMKTIR